MPSPLFSLIEYMHQQHGYKGGNTHADQSRHHETMIEQIFAYDGSATTVKIDRGYIRRIIGAKEIAINTGADT